MGGPNLAGKDNRVEEVMNRYLKSLVSEL